jgi:type IV secretory pathway VirB4 component
MFIKNEIANQADCLADLILWEAMPDDGLLWLQDGALQATWRYEGVDMDSLSPSERRAFCYDLALKLNLGDRWMVESDAMRREVCSYLPVSPGTHPVGRLLEEERRRQFLQPRTFFETRRYLTLTYLPPRLRERRWTQMLAGAEKPVEKSELEAAAEANRQVFEAAASQFEGSITNNFGRCERLRKRLITESDGSTWYDDEYLRFLWECVFGKDEPFARPHFPMDLAALFTASLVPGDTPKLGDQYIRILAIDQWGAGSVPGMFRHLESGDFPYRFHTRAMLMAPEESAKLHAKNAVAWRGQERGIFSQLFSAQGGRLNQDAVEMNLDAGNAEKQARRGILHWGSYNVKFVLQSENREDLEDWAGAITGLLPTGFKIRVETESAMDAWRGTWPGHGYSDVRMVPVNTLHLADGLPLNTPFTGFPYNPSPHLAGAPALMKVATVGDTAAFFNLHVGRRTTTGEDAEGENFNAAILGPTRAGKSFFLSMMVSSWISRYQDSQVFAFDKDASLRTLIWAFGGTYHPLGAAGETVCMAPFADIDEGNNLAWAAGYAELLCVNNGAAIGPPERNNLSEALQKLSNRPKDRRSLTELMVLVQNPKLREALEYYTLNSAASAGILDGSTDSFSRQLMASKYHVFEMKHLLSMDAKVIRGVLPYLFRLITVRLGPPTLISVDEAHNAFKEPEFIAYLISWLKELAKKNAGVVLSTQNITDWMGTAIEHVLNDQCATKIYLPNPSAQFNSKTLYERLGLNPQQISQIATGRERCDYFASSVNGFQKFQLYAGAALKVFIGRNKDPEQARVAELRASLPGTWQAAWLRECGVQDWGNALDRLMQEETQAVGA